MARFIVDNDALDMARLELGIEHGVRILVRRYQSRGGRYIGFEAGEHRVGIHPDLRPRLASRVLWHELTHAAQVERLGGHDAFDAQWWAEMKAAGINRARALTATGRAYKRTPLEREAERNERRSRRLRLAHRSQQ